MRKMTSRASEPTSITVGDLIGQLCRWPDHARIRFRSPGTGPDLFLSRIEGPSRGLIEIEFQVASEAAPVVPVDA